MEWCGHFEMTVRSHRTPLRCTSQTFSGHSAKDPFLRVMPVRIPVEGHSLADQLVPMALATRVINVKVCGRDGSPSPLSDIAHAFAALAPVYTHNADGSAVRQITHQDLISGVFRKNGAELHFLDGRSPIVNIAVTNDAISIVTDALLVPANAEERLG